MKSDFNNVNTEHVNDLSLFNTCWFYAVMAGNMSIHKLYIFFHWYVNQSANIWIGNHKMTERQEPHHYVITYKALHTNGLISSSRVGRLVSYSDKVVETHEVH